MSGKNGSYFSVNLIFVIIIGIVLSYSYFFYPNNHPLECVVKKMTGENCPACGFSRAFSSFSHLELQKGMLFNSLAFPCFLFFISQFFFRASLLGMKTYINITPKFILIEVCITILFFVITFSPLLL